MKSKYKPQPAGWLYIKGGHTVVVDFYHVEPKTFFKSSPATHEEKSAEQQAREYIRSFLGRDDWTLKPQAFLGFQIMCSGANHPERVYPWDDEKANSVAQAVTYLRPKWSVAAEWFNGLMMLDVVDEATEVHFMFGNANDETLGADIYLSVEKMENGEMCGDSLETGLNANTTPVQVLAGAIVGSIETFINFVLPVLRSFKEREMIIDGTV